MVVAIEDAGFAIRDQLGWLYTSGYPKSMDVGRMIDKAERGVPQGGRDHTSPNHGKYKGGSNMGAGPGQFMKQQGSIRKPSAEDLTPNAQPWYGWGIALKPSFEPAVLAQKLTDLTIATNVLTFGTGALAIETSKIAGDDGVRRFPANTITDGSADVLGLFPSAEIATRYFYCAKATEADKAGSGHPTVKPIALMQHLCRLVTRPGGLVLDPFAGSGTTGEAALREGMRAILIEQDPGYCEAMRRRFRYQSLVSFSAA
jgi:site-specific DNA-methyltransferase (adenine-specific)